MTGARKSRMGIKPLRRCGAIPNVVHNGIQGIQHVFHFDELFRPDRSAVAHHDAAGAGDNAEPDFNRSQGRQRGRQRVVLVRRDNASVQ